VRPKPPADRAVAGRQRLGRPGHLNPHRTTVTGGFDHLQTAIPWTERTPRALHLAAIQWLGTVTLDIRLHMTLLGLLVLGNAVLHAIVVGRFGLKGNVPPAVFGIIYAGLALAIFGGWPHAPLAALVVTGVGLLGLTLNFKKLQHDSTIEKIILVVGATTLVCGSYAVLVR
jgi:hypothetical protein